MEGGSNSSLSQDSLASLTAGDVLIRSTGVRREKKPIDAVRGAGGRTKKVTIAVEKLREVVSPCRAAWPGDGTPCLPPALLASRAPCGTVTPGPPRSAAPGAWFTVSVQLWFEVKMAVPRFQSRSRLYN